ncbi:hypothetical protein ACOSQ3_011702 [Xanthoceras sorbifolium]
MPLTAALSPSLSRGSQTARRRSSPPAATAAVLLLPSPPRLVSFHSRRSSSPRIAAAPRLFASPPPLVSLDAAAHLLPWPPLTWEGASDVQYRNLQIIEFGVSGRSFSEHSQTLKFGYNKGQDLH